MAFVDRQHAREVLAKEIQRFKFNPKKTVVTAIPRGGVAVGKMVAEILDLALFPLVIKKLGAPNNKELAIGATASFGKPVLDRWLIAELKINSEYLKKETASRRKKGKGAKKFLG